jgi:HrpA-like RNA helicase
LDRVPRFDPRSGLTRLETMRVSADAAEQRAGRAGRLGPGICYRLWSETTQSRLRPQRIPEILEADLAPLALELAQWGVTEVSALAWLDPPPSGALAQARNYCANWSALDPQDRITSAGQALAKLPAHPRLAQLLRRGMALGLVKLAADLAALLEERDPLRGEHPFGGDFTARLDALQIFAATVATARGAGGPIRRPVSALSKRRGAGGRCYNGMVPKTRRSVSIPPSIQEMARPLDCYWPSLTPTGWRGAERARRIATGWPTDVERG